MQQVIAFIIVRGSSEQRGRRHGAVLAAEAAEGDRLAPSTSTTLTGRPGGAIQKAAYIHKMNISIYINGKVYIHIWPAAR